MTAAVVSTPLARPTVERAPQAPLGWSPRDRRKRIKDVREVPPLTFARGWPADTPSCPRCGGMLAREPAYLHCQFGCGSLFPIVGACVEDQRAYERSGGLSLETAPVDGRTTSQYAVRKGDAKLRR